MFGMFHVPGFIDGRFLPDTDASKKFAPVLFVSPKTNFFSWKITMPLYNSSEVFVPAKQYGNTDTIHSDSLDIK